MVEGGTYGIVLTSEYHELDVMVHKIVHKYVVDIRQRMGGVGA